MIEDGCLAYRFGVSRGQSRGSRQITSFVKCNGKSTRDQIVPRPKEKLRMKPWQLTLSASFFHCEFFNGILLSAMLTFALITSAISIFVVYPSHVKMLDRLPHTENDPKMHPRKIGYADDHPDPINGGLINEMGWGFLVRWTKRITPISGSEMS